MGDRGGGPGLCVGSRWGLVCAWGPGGGPGLAVGPGGGHGLSVGAR